MKAKEAILEELHHWPTKIMFTKGEVFSAMETYAQQANEGLKEAMEKIRDMVLTPEEAIKNEYKYALNRTWHIATEALSNFKQAEK